MTEPNQIPPTVTDPGPVPAQPGYAGHQEVDADHHRLGRGGPNHRPCERWEPLPWQR